jgi:hypothetical protein
MFVGILWPYSRTSGTFISPHRRSSSDTIPKGGYVPPRIGRCRGGAECVAWDRELAGEFLVPGIYSANADADYGQLCSTIKNTARYE